MLFRSLSPEQERAVGLSLAAWRSGPENDARVEGKEERRKTGGGEEAEGMRSREGQGEQEEKGGGVGGEEREKTSRTGDKGEADGKRRRRKKGEDERRGRDGGQLI